MISTFGAHAWAVPAEQFAEAWNGAGSLDEAGHPIRRVAGGPTPRWALMARAAELRQQGFSLRVHTLGAATSGAVIATFPAAQS